MFRALCLVAAYVPSAQAAEVSSALPDPLSLDAALALLDTPHPALARSQANVQRQAAVHRRELASTDLSVDLNGRLRWVDPSATARDQNSDDHRVGLTARKTLYDFGRRQAGSARSLAEWDASRLALLDDRERRYLKIHEDFFAVIEADLRYIRDNEAMSIAFVRADRLKDREELGQVAEVERLELDARYFALRQQRYRAEYDQRATRAQLASVLNHPGQLPATVQRPDLASTLARALPEIDSEIALALAHNTALRGFDARIAAADSAVQQARLNWAPQIIGEAEVYEYSRELGSADRARAGILVNVPLWVGDRRDAAVAERRAEISQLRAERAALALDLRQQVLDTWLALQSLQRQLEAVEVESEFRGVAFDRAQARYELELQAILGEAMIELSAVELRKAVIEFDTTLAWLRLDALTGRLAKRIGNGTPLESTP